MTDRSDPFRGRSFAYRTFARRRPCPRATYCSFTPAHGEHPPLPARLARGRLFCLCPHAKAGCLSVASQAAAPARRAAQSASVRHGAPTDDLPPPILHRFICAGARHKLYAPHLRSCRAPHERRKSAHFPSAAVHPPACSERFCLLCERRKSRRTACKTSSPQHLLLRRKSVRPACFFPPPPRRNFFGEK